MVGLSESPPPDPVPSTPFSPSGGRSASYPRGHQRTLAGFFLKFFGIGIIGSYGWRHPRAPIRASCRSFPKGGALGGSPVRRQGPPPASIPEGPRRWRSLTTAASVGSRCEPRYRQAARRSEPVDRAAWQRPNRRGGPVVVSADPSDAVRPPTAPALAAAQPRPICFRLPLNWAAAPAAFGVPRTIYASAAAITPAWTPRPGRRGPLSPPPPIPPRRVEGCRRFPPPQQMPRRRQAAPWPPPRIGSLPPSPPPAPPQAASARAPPKAPPKPPPPPRRRPFASTRRTSPRRSAASLHVVLNAGLAGGVAGDLAAESFDPNIWPVSHCGRLGSLIPGAAARRRPNRPPRRASKKPPATAA